MNETTSEKENIRRQADCLSDAIRKGLEGVVETLVPPEAARNHFKEARIEFLRGLRAVIDHRIDRVSRTKTTGGTRIVVE